MSSDSVKRYLESRGCDPELVAGGLGGLVEAWARVVEDVARGGYSLGLDDYLNDMDTRDILEGALEASGAGAQAVAARLSTLDKLFLAATRPCDRCLWGPALARDHGWTDEEHWWYFRAPLRPSDELAEDLIAAGLTESR